MVTKMEAEKKPGEKLDMQMLLSGPQSMLDDNLAFNARPKRNKFVLPLLLTSVIGIVVAVVLFLYLAGREETDDAYVDGHISDVSSKVAGTVLKVFVNENEPVKAGQMLVKLDPTDYQVDVDQATAALQESKYQADAAKLKIGQSLLSAEGQTTQATEDVSSVKATIESALADVQQCQADIEQSQAKITELEAQVKFAQSDFDRYKLVYASRGVTQQQYDQAKERLDVAMAQRDQGYQNLSLVKQKKAQAEARLNQTRANLRKSKGGVTSAIATQKQEQIDEDMYEGNLASIKRNQAEVEQAKLRMSYTDITAPISGRIGKKSVEVGQRVEPGQALMALVQDDFWVTANYKETQVGRMHPGQPVEIKIDSFPGKVFKGHVDSIAPASGAKFSLLPPDNATGNFTKVVQRIQVKILIDKDSIGSYKDLIAPGMSCVTTVLIKDK